MLSFLRVGALSTVLLMISLAAFRSSAQGQQAPMLTEIWIRSIENLGKITTLQKFVQQMEEAQLPVRIARIEEKLNWLEWAVKALLAGVALLIVERMKAVLSGRQGKDREDSD